MTSLAWLGTLADPGENVDRKRWSPSWQITGQQLPTRLHIALAQAAEKKAPDHSAPIKQRSQPEPHVTAAKKLNAKRFHALFLENRWNRLHFSSRVIYLFIYFILIAWSIKRQRLYTMLLMAVSVRKRRRKRFLARTLARFTFMTIIVRLTIFTRVRWQQEPVPAVTSYISSIPD